MHPTKTLLRSPTTAPPAARQPREGVTGALDRLAAITGQPAETIALPPLVKPVDGPDLLDAAIGEHQSNRHDARHE